MPTKSLHALAMPLVVSFTFRFLFTLVDLIFVRMIPEQSPHGISAIGLFIPIQTLFVAIWVGLSAGFTATLSQAFGRQDQTRVDTLKAAMVRIHIALVVVLLALAGGIYLATPLLKLEPSLERDFLTYALILVIAMPFSGFLSIYPDSIVKAHHDTVSTMKAGVLSTLTNVVLNTVFVFLFHWGIAGLALATALSRYAGVIYAALRTRVLERARQTPDWDRGPTTWDRGPMADILTLGLPGALASSLTLAEVAVAESLILGAPAGLDPEHGLTPELAATALAVQQEQSAAYLAAFAIYDRITALAIMPAVATAVAVLPFVARLVAEGRREEVAPELRRSSWITAGLVAAIAIPAGWLFPALIAGYMVKESTPEAADEVASYLRLIPFAALALVPFLLLRPVFEAVGRPRLGVRITIVKSMLLCVPLAVLGFFAASSTGQDPLFGLLLGAIVGQLAASGMAVRACRKLLSRDLPATGPV